MVSIMKLRVFGSLVGGLQPYRGISTTAILNAEPPRKRRRIDPAMLKIRVERKMKKAEREIARIESQPKKLIPILEYELEPAELNELTERPVHKLEEFDVSERIFQAAGRLWSFHRKEQVRIQDASIARVQLAQSAALDELKRLDPNLYDRTVTADEAGLIPYTSRFLRKETPPNPNYIPPDGSIRDMSKEWTI